MIVPCWRAEAAPRCIPLDQVRHSGRIMLAVRRDQHSHSHLGRHSFGTDLHTARLDGGDLIPAVAHDAVTVPNRLTVCLVVIEL